MGHPHLPVRSFESLDILVGGGIIKDSGLDRLDIANALIESGYPREVGVMITGSDNERHFPRAEGHVTSPMVAIQAFLLPEAFLIAARNKQFTPVIFYEMLMDVFLKGPPSEKRWAAERLAKSMKEIAAFSGLFMKQSASTTRRTADDGTTVTEETLTLQRLAQSCTEQARNDHVTLGDLSFVLPPSDRPLTDTPHPGSAPVPTHPDHRPKETPAPPPSLDSLLDARGIVAAKAQDPPASPR